MTRRKEKGQLSLDFNSRSAADRAHAVRRPYAEKKPYEHLSDEMPPFFEDIQRIEGSAAWRRLKDLYQYRPGTHFSVQNRLTHTMIAKNVGEVICRRLGLGQDSIDLVRAIITAHDIGHPPFTHRGEAALKEIMAPYGMQWNHDMAGLRVVNEWANLTRSFNGLNLTLDVLEGLAKRYWRFVGRPPQNRYEHDIAELPESIREIDLHHNLHLDRFNHIEGQIASISDWIAFSATDIEDGLKMGELNWEDLKDDFPFIEEILEQFAPHKDIPAETLCRHIRTRLIDDVVAQTNENIRQARLEGRLNAADDVRNLDRLLVCFSPAVLAAALEMDNKHTARERASHQFFVKEMAEAYITGKLSMRGSWRKRLADIKSEKAANDNGRDARIAELVCAYITCEITDQDVMNYISRTRAQTEKPEAQNGGPQPG